MPVNMMDWEAQQRARKEQERKNKLEATATLHTFRGAASSEIESNLANMKKEDRQKTLDAEKTLHSYRANMEVIGKGMKKATVPRSLQDASAGEFLVEVTPDVSVSALAEAFNKTSPENELITGTAPNMNRTFAEETIPEPQPEPAALSLFTRPTEPALNPESVSSQVPVSVANDPVVDDEPLTALSVVAPLEPPAAAAADSADSAAMFTPDIQEVPDTSTTNRELEFTMPTDLPLIPEGLPQEISMPPDDCVVVENHDETTNFDMTESMVVVDMAADDWVDVKASDAKAHSEDEYSTMTTRHSNVEGHVETPVAPVRLDVEFYFAVLTDSPSPDMSRYMTAIVRVFGPLLGRTIGTSGIVSIRPHFPPYIRRVETDHGYYDMQGRSPAVHRYQVHASLPVFLEKSTGGGADARNGMLQLLRQAVENGSLRDAATSSP